MTSVELPINIVSLPTNLAASIHCSDFQLSPGDLLMLISLPLSLQGLRNLKGSKLGLGPGLPTDFHIEGDLKFCQTKKNYQTFFFKFLRSRPLKIHFLGIKIRHKPTNRIFSIHIFPY